MTNWPAQLAMMEAEVSGIEPDGPALVRSVSVSLQYASDASSMMAFHLLDHAEDDLRAAASMLPQARAVIARELADECRQAKDCDLRTLPDVASAHGESDVTDAQLASATHKAVDDANEVLARADATL